MILLKIYSLWPTICSFVGLNAVYKTLEKFRSSWSCDRWRHQGNNTMKDTSNKHLHTCKFMLQCALNSRGYASRPSSPDFRFLCFLCIAPLTLQRKTINGHFYILHTNLFLSTLVIFELIDVTESSSSGKRNLFFVKWVSTVKLWPKV